MRTLIKLFFSLIAVTTILAIAASKQEALNAPVLEITCAIIKPDAVTNGHTGTIIKLIELNGFDIKQLKKIQLTRKQAEQFYAVHTKKQFFNELVKYMTSGPIIALELSKEAALEDWRKLIGATDPKKSPVGTLRRMFGTSVTKNALHGSDSAESAKKEINLLFQ
jgi:nucleoside-diphosphate kinase